MTRLLNFISAPDSDSPERRLTISAVPPPPPPAKSPARRLWWIIPIGCLVMAGIGVSLFAGIFVLVFSLIKNSGPYQNAMEVASQHPAVIEVTGEPVETGWFVMGNIQTTNDSGNADISIPVSGPNGSGRVHVVATRNAGVWYFDLLTFADSAGGPPVSLLTDL